MSEASWSLVARFVTGADEVQFVKAHVETGMLRCTCRRFAMAALDGAGTCEHCEYAREYIVDAEAGITVTEVPPEETIRAGLFKHWLERHVQQIEGLTDTSELS